MATMRLTLQRVTVGWIAVWLIGVLIGASAVAGVEHLRSASPNSNAVAVQPGAASADQAGIPVAGGRMGGITSLDTANDAAIRSGLAGSAKLLTPPFDRSVEGPQ